MVRPSKKKICGRNVCSSGRDVVGEKRKSFKEARCEEVEESKKLRIQHENFRKEHADVLSEGFCGPHRSITCNCTCSGCQSTNGGSRVVLEKRMLGSQGPLKNVPEMKAELNAHGVSTGALKKEALKIELQELIEKNAYYLTKMAAQLEAPVEACMSPPSPDADRHIRSAITRSPGRYSTPVTPVDTRDSRDKRARRQSEAADVAEDLPVFWKEGVADDPAMADVYGLAFRAVTAKVLTYDGYLTFMTARPVVRKLTEFEWDKVMLISFVLAERLLDEYLDEGAKVARSVHESLRDHSHVDWREYWPLGHHEERRRALEVDTAWAVQGYTSQHGVTHIQDCMTQLILAVCHLTKNSDDNEVTLN